MLAFNTGLLVFSTRDVTRMLLPQEEARFWSLLPAALTRSPGQPLPALWDAAAEVAHCEERVQWHEAMRLPHDDPRIQVYSCVDSC